MDSPGSQGTQVSQVGMAMQSREYADNFEKIHNFDQNFTILFKFQNLDQKLQFLPKITILTKNYNFDRKSQFWPKITISIKFHNFYQIVHFWPNVFQ